MTKKTGYSARSEDTFYVQPSVVDIVMSPTLAVIDLAGTDLTKSKFNQAKCWITNPSQVQTESFLLCPNAFFMHVICMKNAGYSWQKYLFIHTFIQNVSKCTIFYVTLFYNLIWPANKKPLTKCQIIVQYLVIDRSQYWFCLNCKYDEGFRVFSSCLVSHFVSFMSSKYPER